MNVELSKRAQRAVTRIDARWRKCAEHPELFFVEMLEWHLAVEFVNWTRMYIEALSKHQL